MIQIENTIVSFDVFDEHFVCDLNNCKGICCVEGDAGAPLELHEIDEIKKILAEIWDDLPKSSQEVILKQGVYYIDEDEEPVTSIVNGRECVFAYIDEHGIYKCAIEKAYKEGKSNFVKPISCHLYPIRVQKYKEFDVVNYHRWNICSCAVKLGNKLKVPCINF